jgi:hypothetical protein
MLVCLKPCSYFFALAMASSTSAAADEGHERHHLLDGYERVRFVGFAEQQHRSRRHGPPGAAGQYGGVLAHEVLGRRVVPVVADLDDRVAKSVRRSRGRSTAPHRPAPSLPSSASKTLIDDEHFLLGDAQQVVVVRGALDDAAGGAVQVGRFVDHHRRIAGPGNDRPLAAVQRRSSHAGPPVTQISRRRGA